MGCASAGEMPITSIKKTVNVPKTAFLFILIPFSPLRQVQLLLSQHSWADSPTCSWESPVSASAASYVAFYLLELIGCYLTGRVPSLGDV